MSLGKLPTLKSLVSGTHPKRRQRHDLTLDMIGPPLDDFRHTMHVGRGGDVFGDTSFLSEHGGNAAESPSKGGFFARTLRHVRSPLRGRGGSIKSETAAITYPPPPVSPIIKNAVSLPQLNEIANGGSERFTYKSAPINNTSENMYHYGLESGFCTIPRLSRQERTPEPSYALEDPEDPESEEDSEPDTEGCDSLQSFHLDFGPSLMSEVLGGIGFPASIAEEEEEEEEHGWGYSRSGNPCGTMTNGHFAQQSQDLQRERCAEPVTNHQASWEHTSHLQDTLAIRLNGVGSHETPQAVLAVDHNSFKRDTDSVTKPTPSPRRQRESWQKERPGPCGDQEHMGTANPDLKAETTPQAQSFPLSKVGMRPGEFSRVARVLDHYYGATPGEPCKEELEEEVLPLPQEEEETKAPAPKASRVYLALRGGAFAYAEEEEDDEVKL